MAEMSDGKKSIGIIGGMGPLATADLFQKIVSLTDADSDNGHIRIYIDNNVNIPDRTAAILAGGADPLPEMTESARKLEACGADCLILPCNTAHYFVPRLQERTKLPILNMLEIAAEVCRTRFAGKTVGVLATRGTLASGIYSRVLEKAGVPYRIPSESAQDSLMTVIYQGVKAGRPLEEVRAPIEQALTELSGDGADFFLLACTELPLAAAGLQLSQVFVDPTEELAKASIRYCGYRVRGE